MPELTGTVTFLFSDIEGSTSLLQRLGDSRYADVLAAHQRLLRAAFKEADGHEIDSQGDAFLVTFPRARDAVAATVIGQRAIATHPWPDGVPVRVRMGLHTGEPVRSLKRYIGMDVHRAARICAAAHGGQILLSRTTHDLIERDPPRDVGLRDLGEHRLKDLQRPEQIFQVVHPDLPAAFPPLKSLDRVPHNLPIQLTNFIGREREVAEVKRLLASSRLLTLTGVGGSGKTRLALQTTAEVFEGFANGIWLVELAGLTDPTLIPQLVASVFGLREESISPGSDDPSPSGTSKQRPLVALLVDYLQTKQLLLVLDNCEHLIAACARLAETLLRACPRLHILATSREALGIAGETTWRVPSLLLPDPQDLVPSERLPDYEAVRLFIDRATSALPSFPVTDQNVRAVAKICHRLDGIPLAIELAAVRVKGLAVEQIAARLDDRFRLLTGGSRTALPRQQTLRAAIDWSYDLLSENERVLLRRLSVFAGGFGLEAVEAICGSGSLGESEILELLMRLVDKSLVLMDQPNGEARYRLLDTVRQYSRDKLLESGEASVVRERHRDWFLSFIERMAPEFQGLQENLWLDRVEAEHDNLRAALEWSLGEEESEAGLRLAGGLELFWRVRGYLSEGRKWLERALLSSPKTTTLARRNALAGAALLAAFQGDLERSAVLAEECLATSQATGDQKHFGWALSILGGVASAKGDLTRALALREQALDQFRVLGDQWWITASLYLLGIVARHLGDFERAAVLTEESLARARVLGNERLIANGLASMGILEALQGHNQRAATLLRESLVLFQKLKFKLRIAGNFVDLARVARAEGQFEFAARLLGAAQTLYKELGIVLSPSQQSTFSQDVTAVCAGLGEEAFTAAQDAGRTMTLDQAVAYALAKA